MIYRRPVSCLAAPALALILGAGLPAMGQATSTEPTQSKAGQGAGQAAEAAKVEDRWYSVEMSGVRAGYMHVQTRETAEQVITKTRMQMKLARGEMNIEIRMDSESVETSEGKPVRMSSKSKLGQMAVDQLWTFKGDEIEVATTQAGRTSTKMVPAPVGEWMMPGAADRYSREQLKAGAKEIVIKTVDVQSGPVIVTSSRKGFEATKLEIDGKQVDAIKTAVTLEAGQEVKSTEYIDQNGDLLKSQTSLAGLDLVMVRTTRALATGAAGGGAGGGGAQVPEIMVSTFVKPDKVIERCREVKGATYVLRVKEGDLPALPTTGSQQVTVIDQASATVVVTSQEPMSAAPADATNKVYTGSSAMIDTGDEKIREFVNRALKGLEQASAGEKAKRLRKEVNEFIKAKNLGVGMATASEVVRTREGDCSEHGVLLAAALRVAGIPSRVATGLIYADQFAGGQDIFGYHMWRRVCCPNAKGELAWTDLDATLAPGHRGYDATHITIAVTSLDDTEGVQSLISIANVMGNLEINVQHVSYDDEGMMSDSIPNPKAGK